MEYRIDIAPAIPRTPRKTLDDVPPHISKRLAVKLYILGALVWEYADTVLEIAAQMRIPETRKASRAVRQLRQSWHAFCSVDLDAAHIADIKRLAGLFDDINARHISRLGDGLKTEINREHALCDRWRYLVQAVQMAMTVIDVMRLYSEKCDKTLRGYGVRHVHSVMPDHFTRLAMLLPEFAGDSFSPDSTSRRITAKILLNELESIELFDDNGKV